MHNTNLGFTLIELMVVMLLISIVLAVAIPRFEGAPFQDPEKKISRWMINTLRNLRSAAIQKQKMQALVIDFDNQRMWTINDGMDEEALAAASEKATPLKDGLKFVDVQFEQQDSINNGTVEIKFYPAGYSDRVLIHLETNNADKLTFLVEPLLPKVKIFEEWIEF